ncbi:hypothetical protein N0S72_27100, partial [Klebsiella pneumoniae]|uniref:hypothetical protein n=2 Tax=Klebsiella pneumoniae TaxID=573 RepID=UPI0021804C23
FFITGWQGTYCHCLFFVLHLIYIDMAQAIFSSLFNNSGSANTHLPGIILLSLSTGRRFLNATAACLKPMIHKISLFLRLWASACEINSSIFKIISR